MFAIASFALIAMTRKPVRQRVIAGEGTDKANGPVPWPLFIYCGVTGLGYSWACAFLWFSRRYALFSGPVLWALSLILGLYAVIGLAVIRLTGGNWRTALLALAAVPCAISGIVLRLGILH